MTKAIRRLLAQGREIDRCVSVLARGPEDGGPRLRELRATLDGAIVRAFEAMLAIDRVVHDDMKMLCAGKLDTVLFKPEIVVPGTTVLVGVRIRDRVGTSPTPCGHCSTSTAFLSSKGEPLCRPCSLVLDPFVTKGRPS